MIDQRLKSPLICILAWIVGAALWNVAGVLLIATTGTGIGPTASLTVVGVLAIIAALLYLAARFNSLLFAALSALCAALAFVAVFQAFAGDPSLWPSPFWRWAGAALNLFGFVAGLIGVMNGFRSSRRAGRKPNDEGV